LRQSHLASLALGALLSSACGEQPADFYVHDTAVVVQTSAPFASRPEFPSRIESTISAALAYWGGDWRALRGRTVALSGDANVSCGANSSTLGCFDGNIRFTTSDPGLGTFHCVEQTVLVHEIGHAVIGDPLHEDPRWMQLEPVEAALAGRVGYTADGETDCTIYVSVWRHLRGTR
jgi:hypothetical protein